MKDRIKQIALSFVGRQEIPGNLGFKDDRFEELMVDVGWKKGQAWCSYFAELVWKLAFKELHPELLSVIDGLFSAGAVATYNKFKDSNFVVDKKPEIGSVAIWQTWKNNQPHWSGHAGIVVGICGGNEILTVEGNTNASGGREGIEVAQKRRKLSFDAKTGLVLKGFLHPTLKI